MGRTDSIPLSPFSPQFWRIVEALRSSFVPHKGVPLCLAEVEPTYFTTTTATTLLALHHIKALDDRLREQFQETIFWLRDHTENLTASKKRPEDSAAWD